MALHADFKNRGGLQSLFNPKAGKKVFAASFESVLPDAAPASRPKQTGGTGGTGGKFALPPLQAAPKAAVPDPPPARRDLNDSPMLPLAPRPSIDEPLEEFQGFSRVFQTAVQGLVRHVHDTAKPEMGSTEPELEDRPVEKIEREDKDLAAKMPPVTSTSSEVPKPPDARRRVLARTRLPAKPETIDDIKNIEVFAERLVDAFGSLTKAFEAFDSHGRSEVTRSQFDAALDAMKLDVEELCGIPASKLFSLVSRASKKPIGALTEQAWTSFFKKYLGKTASAHLLEADYNIENALSQLAELHSLQPARDKTRQDDQASSSGPRPRRWGVIAAAVLDDSTLAKLAILDPSETSKSSSKAAAGSGRRRGAAGLEDADGSSGSDSDSDSNPDGDAALGSRRRVLNEEEAGDASIDGERGNAALGAGGDLHGNGALSDENGAGAGHSKAGNGGTGTGSDGQDRADANHGAVLAGGVAGDADSSDSSSRFGSKRAGVDVSDGDGLSSGATRDPGSEQTGLARTSSKSHPDPSGFGHGQGPGDGYGNGSHDHAGIGGSDANGQGSASRAQALSGRQAGTDAASGQESSNLDDAFGSESSGMPFARRAQVAGGDAFSGRDGFRDTDGKDRRAGRTGLSASVTADELDGGLVGSDSFAGAAEDSRRAYHSEPDDLLAKVKEESRHPGTSGTADEAGDVSSGLRAIYAEGKVESSDSEADDEISSVEEDKSAGDLQSLVKRVFKLYATGYSKGQYVFIRNPDLARFMEDAREALPGHRKKFRRFKRIFESIFDDTIQLQCDMPGQGLRITAGLTLDWFQVFVQKAVRRVGSEVMGFFMALLEAQGC